MAANNFQKLSDADLQTLAARFISIVGAGPTSYGLTGAQIVTLTTNDDNYVDAVTAFTDAKTTAKAASADRDAKKAVLVDNLSTLAKTIYNNPSVTDTMIADAGLQPRDSGRTPIVPTTPVDLLANAFADGHVDLKLGRNGNAYGVTFLVEAQSPGAETWTVVATTTKSKATVFGFAPGEAKWFRVRAEKNGISSEPSLPAPIYVPSSSLTIQLAA